MPCPSKCSLAIALPPSLGGHMRYIELYLELHYVVNCSLIRIIFFHPPSRKGSKGEEVHYSSYLQLDKILSAQTLRSKEVGGKAVHDEHFFIVIHQGVCGGGCDCVVPACMWRLYTATSEPSRCTLQV